MALFTAFLTAFYTFRAYFLTFFGPLQVPPEAGSHAHESPPVMWVPLAVLAFCAFAVGFVFETGHGFAEFIARAPSLSFLVDGGTVDLGPFHFDIAVASTLVALSGIGLAAFFYLGDQREVNMLARLLAPLYRLSRDKFYIDELYGAAIVWPLRVVAALCSWLDHWVVDGLVNAVGRVPVAVGNVARRSQRRQRRFW